MNAFQGFFEAMNRARVKYMVAGGIAVNLYGIERATADLDIAVLLEEKNLSRFVSVSKKLGLRPKIPVTLDDLCDAVKRKAWATEKGLQVFSLIDPESPFFLIDIFIEIVFDFQDAYKRRTIVRFENTSIPVVPLDTLIEMKKNTGRPQDVADVIHLTRIQEITQNGR